MDRLTELGTAPGFAEQRVAQAKRNLAEAEAQLAQADTAYWGYVGDNCLCDFVGDPECPIHAAQPT